MGTKTHTHILSFLFFSDTHTGQLLNLCGMEKEERFFS